MGRNSDAENDEIERRNEQQRADGWESVKVQTISHIYDKVTDILEYLRPRKWEYREETNMPVAELNKLGAEGWELIAVQVVVLAADKVDTFYTFKRQL